MSGKRNGSPRKRRAPRSASATERSQTVIGYARVSTAGQAERGISLDEQEHRIRSYAAAHGLEIVRVERDAGISAKTTTNRPALLRALEGLKKGTAGGLIVCKLDRLSRSLRDALDLVSRSNREGWELHSIGESLDTSNAMGRFVVHLFAALAQLEREQIGERTRDGLAELRRQGKRISGRPPFGYRFDDGAVVVDDHEHAVLLAMLEANDDGDGPAAITTRLNDRGIVNPRTGLPWTRGNVGAILRTAGQRSDP